MGRAFAESVPAARAVFEDARSRRRLRPRPTLCFEGPLERALRDRGHAARARRRDDRLPARPWSEAGLRPTSSSATASASTRPWSPRARSRRPDAVRLVRERGLATAAAAAEHAGRDGRRDRARRRRVVEHLCDGDRRRLARELQLPRPGRRVAAPWTGVAGADGGGRGRRRAPGDPAQGLGRLPQPAHRRRPSRGCGGASTQVEFHEPDDARSSRPSACGLATAEEIPRAARASS